MTTILKKEDIGLREKDCVRPLQICIADIIALIKTFNFEMTMEVSYICYLLVNECWHKL